LVTSGLDWISFCIASGNCWLVGDGVLSISALDILESQATTTLWSLDLLHKSKKGEAFADKNPDFTDKSGRKCFAPTAKNRLLQEVY
jgi:hypothetical protein